MTNIVAFVGESFFKKGSSYFAKPTSAAFLQDAIGLENVYVCSPYFGLISSESKFSTEVPSKHFYEFPPYASTKDFIIKRLLGIRYSYEFRKKCDYVIDKHVGDIFWIRTPSIGSIYFGMRVLKKGGKLLNHVCADVSNTWRNPKYSKFEKILGFLASRYIIKRLSYICSHQNTINLCTGNRLEQFTRRLAPERTFQFVDLMINKEKCVASTLVNRSPFKLLFVGRVVEDKGVLDLIRVVARLGCNVSLSVVGDGEDLSNAKHLAESLGVRDQVDFSGQVSHCLLANYFKSAHLVVVPSNNHYEGFPRVIMEAWAHHLPIVVTDVGGIRSFVRNRYNALIIKPGDNEGLYLSISSLVNNCSLYNEIKNGAIKSSDISNQKYWIDVMLSSINKLNSI